MSTHLVLDRGRAAVASLLALLLLVAGVITAPAATALDASATATVTSASADTGLTVRVAASALPEVAFAYAAIIPAGGEGSVSAGGGYLAMNPFAPVSGGTLSLDLVAPATGLDRTAAYEVLIWRQHSNPTPDNIYTRAAITVSPDQWAAVFPATATTTTLTVDPAASSAAGADFTLGAIVEPAASGTVQYFDGDTVLGSAAVGTTVTARIGTAGTAQLKAVFTPSDASAFAGSTSAVVAYEITTAPVETRPVLTLSKSAGLSPDGETVTVTGTGYNPNQPIYVAICTDIPLADLSFAFIAAGCTVGAKQVTSNPTSPTQVRFNPDGSFTTEFRVSPKTGSTAVYTLANHTAQSDRSQDAKVSVTFAAPAPVPTQGVTVTDASAAAGATVKVVASGLGDITGAYAAVIEKGTEASVSAGGGYAVMKFVQGITGGTFSVDLIAATAKLDRTTQYEVIVWRQHSNPGADTIYVRADVPITADHWVKLFPGTLPPVEPGTPVAPPVAQGAGSLKWAISSSFSAYVTGGIAHGSIAVSGGATRAGGQFQFGQAAGSTYDAATGLGTVSYTGAVRFTGHGGALDVTIANPQIRVTSPSAATLSVTSGGSQVPFATLNLAAAARVTANGTVTYSNAPATLTAAGRDQVLGGNTTPLDAVTFTIGVPAAAPAGSTGTIATAAATTPRTAPIPATPPASTGIELDDDTLAALQNGEPVAVSASGFEPGEAGIQVVVYSTPTLLGEITADASGTATWTGTLPATLADGEHTLTFQGSVDRGIRFTLARAAVATGCTVEASRLNWGFKESFRTYIEGIAAGGWELTDVAYEFPEFVWNAGTGTVDAETRTGLVTYGGSIRFTGHQGALDTTLSNARVELAGDTGYLVFDVSGTTQAGEPVTAAGIRLAEFALPDLEVTGDGLVLDALPATLTDAGAAAFGTYPAGEELDPVTAVLPVSADCAAGAAPAEDEAAVAEAAEAETLATEPASAPVWPWAVGGVALVLVAGAAVWIAIARRRATAGGDGDPTAG